MSDRATAVDQLSDGLSESARQMAELDGKEPVVWSDQLELPPMKLRRAGLRPIARDDFEFVHELLTGASPQTLGASWDQTVGPPPEADVFVPRVLSQALTAFLIIATDVERSRAGVCLAQSVDWNSGHASIGVVVKGRYEHSGVGIEAGALFVNYLFSRYRLRKLYTQTIDFAYQRFGRQADSGYAVEGRLKDHTYLFGRYWDSVILAIYRQQWEEWKDALNRPGSISGRKVDGS